MLALAVRVSITISSFGSFANNSLQHFTHGSIHVMTHIAPHPPHYPHCCSLIAVVSCFIPRARFWLNCRRTALTISSKDIKQVSPC